MLVFSCSCGIIIFAFYAKGIDDSMPEEKKKIDWTIVIPLMFWVLFMGMSIGKIYQTGNEVSLIDWLDVLNGNTFSTFISMVIVMAYQFFSDENVQRKDDFGLSRKGIPVTIIATIIYGIVAIVNAARYCLITAIIMALCSVAYIIIFFTVMRK